MKKIGLSMVIFLLGGLIGAEGMYWTGVRAARTPSGAQIGRQAIQAGPNTSRNLPPGAFGRRQYPRSTRAGRARGGPLPPGYIPPSGTPGARRGDSRSGRSLPQEAKVTGEIKKLTKTGSQQFALFLIEQVRYYRTLGRQPSSGPSSSRPPLASGRTVQIKIGPAVETTIKPGPYAAVLRFPGGATAGPPTAIWLEKTETGKDQ